jgi:hypothetical protein
MNRQERILSLALIYKMSDDTLLSMYKDLTAYRKDYPKGDSRIDHFIMIVEDEMQNRLEINLDL